MPDIASLGFAVDSNSLDQGTDKLGKFRQEANKTADAVDNLEKKLKTGTATQKDYEAAVRQSTGITSELTRAEIDMINSLEKQRALLGLTNTQRQIFNNLERAGTTASTEAGRAIASLTTQLAAAQTAKAGVAREARNLHNAYGLLSGSTNEMRTALATVSPALIVAGTNLSNLSRFAWIARGGLIGVAGAITGALVVAVENAGDRIFTLQQRFSDLLRSNTGASNALEGLRRTSRETGVDITHLQGAFEALTKSQRELAANMGFRSAPGADSIIPGLNQQSIQRALDAMANLEKTAGPAIEQFFKDIARSGGLTKETFDTLENASPRLARAVAAAFRVEDIVRFRQQLEATPISTQRVLQELSSQGERLKQRFGSDRDLIAEGFNKIKASFNDLLMEFAKAGGFDQIGRALKFVSESINEFVKSGGAKQLATDVGEMLKDLGQWVKDGGLKAIADDLRIIAGAIDLVIRGARGTRDLLRQLGEDWEASKRMWSGQGFDPNTGARIPNDDTPGRAGKFGSENLAGLSALDQQVQDLNTNAAPAATALGRVNPAMSGLTGMAEAFASELVGAAGVVSGATVRIAAAVASVPTNLGSDAGPGVIADIGNNAGGGVYSMSQYGGIDDITLKGQVSSNEVVAVLPHDVVTKDLMDRIRKAIGKSPIVHTGTMDRNGNASLDLLNKILAMGGPTTGLPVSQAALAKLQEMMRQQNSGTALVHPQIAIGGSGSSGSNNVGQGGGDGGRGDGDRYAAQVQQWLAAENRYASIYGRNGRVGGGLTRSFGPMSDGSVVGTPTGLPPGSRSVPPGIFDNIPFKSGQAMLDSMLGPAAMSSDMFSPSSKFFDPFSTFSDPAFTGISSPGDLWGATLPTSFSNPWGLSAATGITNGVDGRPEWARGTSRPSLRGHWEMPKREPFMTPLRTWRSPYQGPGIRNPQTGGFMTDPWDDFPGTAKLYKETPAVREEFERQWIARGGWVPQSSGGWGPAQPNWVRNPDGSWAPPGQSDAQIAARATQSPVSTTDTQGNITVRPVTDPFERAMFGTTGTSMTEGMLRSVEQVMGAGYGDMSGGTSLDTASSFMGGFTGPGFGIGGDFSGDAFGGQSIGGMSSYIDQSSLDTGDYSGGDYGGDYYGGSPGGFASGFGSDMGRSDIDYGGWGGIDDYLTDYYADTFQGAAGGGWGGGGGGGWDNSYSAGDYYNSAGVYQDYGMDWGSAGTDGGWSDQYTGGGGFDVYGGEFAKGGSFRVPNVGSGGTDSVRVGLKATPGERVSVDDPGAMDAISTAAGGGGRDIIVNVYTPDVKGFARSRLQVARAMRKAMGPGAR